MNEYCEVEVTIRRVSERSYKVSGSNYRYTNNHQASLYSDLFTIPRSQVRGMKDLGDGRRIMVLPKWLVEKVGLDQFVCFDNSSTSASSDRSSPPNKGKSQMDVEHVARQLAAMDSLESWKDCCPDIGPSLKQQVYKKAELLWLERMARTGLLLVHPEIMEQLEAQSWQASDLQKRMIWASVIASLEGKDSKQRFREIKTKLLKKYGRDWWEDVFKRKTSAWAAKERMLKNTKSYGAAVTTLIDNTHLFAGIASDEKGRALRMIPKT